MNILINKKHFFIVFIAILAMSFVFASPTNAAKKNKSGIQLLHFKAQDGFNLAGYIHVPKKNSVKTKIPLVIFIHSIGRDSDSWLTFPSQIYGLGIATFSLDLRGHGESIKNKNDKYRYWINFDNKDFAKYPEDIISAINYIKKQYPEVDTGKTAIIAAGIGANAAIIAGSKNNTAVKTMILLSPTLSYKGLETRIPLVAYGNHPILILASREDTFAYKGSSELIKYGQGTKELKIFPYGGDGIDLIKFQPETKGIIINWLKTKLLNIK